MFVSVCLYFIPFLFGLFDWNIWMKLKRSHSGKLATWLDWFLSQVKWGRAGGWNGSNRRGSGDFVTTESIWFESKSRREWVGREGGGREGGRVERVHWSRDVIFICWTFAKRETKRLEWIIKSNRIVGSSRGRASDGREGEGRVRAQASIKLCREYWMDLKRGFQSH